MRSRRFIIVAGGALAVLLLWAAADAVTGAAADTGFDKEGKPGLGATATATPTPCSVSFSDVRPSDYFYEAVQYLYCHGVISGYSDGTFRPGNNVTRAQVTKILVLAFHIPIYIPPRPTFCDVPADHPFFVYIESYTNYVGRCFDCDCFRPNNQMTRGQLCKVVALLACWPIINPPNPTFSDVAYGSTFYQYIETAYSRGVISGYADGTFRPSNTVTRGQTSKIMYRSVLQGSFCPTPTPTPIPTQSVGP